MKEGNVKFEDFLPKYLTIFLTKMYSHFAHWPKQEIKLQKKKLSAPYFENPCFKLMCGLMDFEYRYFNITRLQRADFLLAFFHLLWPDLPSQEIKPGQMVAEWVSRCVWFIRLFFLGSPFYKNWISQKWDSSV